MASSKSACGNACAIVDMSPLADKIMCNHCRNKYPLGLYYFPEYKPYITEAEVEHVRMESQADYIDPANLGSC